MQADSTSTVTEGSVICMSSRLHTRVSRTDFGMGYVPYHFAFIPAPLCYIEMGLDLKHAQGCKGPFKNHVILLGGRGGHQKITNDHREVGEVPEKIT